MFFDYILKMLRNSNSPFQVASDILHLSFLYDFFIFFYVSWVLRFDKVTFLPFIFKFILSEGLNSSLRGNYVLLFS